jgi:hypothetical protein
MVRRSAGGQTKSMEQRADHEQTRHEVLLRAIDHLIAEKSDLSGENVKDELDTLRSLRARAVIEFDRRRGRHRPDDR